MAEDPLGQWVEKVLRSRGFPRLPQIGGSGAFKWRAPPVTPGELAGLVIDAMQPIGPWSRAGDRKRRGEARTKLQNLGRRLPVPPPPLPPEINLP